VEQGCIVEHGHGDYRQYFQIVAAGQRLSHQGDDHAGVQAGVHIREQPIQML
jgi:hypothetical protein